MKQLTTIYEKILYALNDLPGEFAHQEMYPLRKTISQLDLTATNYRTSAVLVLLFIESKSIKIVLTQRQIYKGSHGGQISFPGGKKEEQDENNIATALRETQEEIGVDPKSVEIIGKLTDVYIPVSNFLVHPYIGYCEERPKFILNHYEVKEIICFQLRELLNDDSKTTRDLKTIDGLKLKDIPCFLLEDKIVWGATALILNELKHILNK